MQCFFQSVRFLIDFSSPILSSSLLLCRLLFFFFSSLLSFVSSRFHRSSSCYKFVSGYMRCRLRNSRMLQGHGILTNSIILAKLQISDCVKATGLLTLSRQDILFFFYRWEEGADADSTTSSSIIPRGEDKALIPMTH